MNPLELPEAFQECLAGFEGFRKLGFDPDDIYFMINGPLTVPRSDFGKYQLLMLLKTQGKEFKLSCGVIAETREHIAEMWRRVAAAMEDGSICKDGLDTVWDKSLPHRDAVGFLSAIVAKGIRVPRSMN